MSEPEDQNISFTLHPRMQRLRPSATLAINETSRRLISEGRVVYKLGFGQSPFPVPESVVATLRDNAGQKDYLPVRGLAQLREAVAAFHRRRDQVEVSGADVLIGPGSKELMFLLQMVCGADLFLPSPSWVSYEPQAHLLGLKVHYLPTLKEDNWLLQPGVLDEHCRAGAGRPQLLVLNSPNNPTGQAFSHEQLARLAEVARAHHLLVLSDEIYGEVHHSGAHISIARYHPRGTIISGGLSKWCGAGGWRLGTFCFPPSLRPLLEAMACAASETYSCVTAPVQYAAVTAYQGNDEIENYVRQSRRLLRALGNRVCDMLNEAGIETAAPAGGFYLFPDFTSHQPGLRARGITTSRALCERLLQEAGVALLPGSDFGRPGDELTCRLAYVDFDGSRALSALDALPGGQELSGDFLREYCAAVLTAIDRICDWLQQPA